ncbi:hypothetical protein EBU58_08975, partial [bacterium]|nr:hypothetical protein [bacterium]
ERIEFTGIENLVGGDGNDGFAFVDGASITGVIDGGTGENGLDYGDYETAIVIDLGQATATGTGGFRNITGVTGGEASDTLRGPAADAAWRISSSDGGEVEFGEGEAVLFAGIENVTGYDTTTDSFLVTADGSLSGSIAGGLGGLDNLAVETDTADTYVIVNTASTAAGSFTQFGKTIRFAGVEPVLAGTTTARVISGSFLPERFLIESVDAANVRLISDTVDFYDVASGQQVDRLTFVLPSESLTVSLGLSINQLTVGALQGVIPPIIFTGSEDILAGSDIDNAWTITGENTGTLNGLVTFTGVANLLGGAADDRFVYAEDGLITGSVSGGSGGLDTLDFSAGSTARVIEVELDNEGIDAFIGTGGSDTLIGLNATNTWTVSGTNAGSIAATSSHEVLLSGGETVVDTSSSTIRLPFLHDFSTGESVRYTSSDPASASSGLVSDAVYSVLVVDDFAFRLTLGVAELANLSGGAWSSGTRTLTPTGGSSISLESDQIEIDPWAQTIGFASPHGLPDGAAVAYAFTGETDTSGLENAKTYTVLVVDESTIKLLVDPPSVLPLNGYAWDSQEPSSLQLEEAFPTVSFEGFENLRGGASGDTFVMQAEGAVSGTLDGGGGSNTLDYSAFQTAVTVDMAIVDPSPMTAAAGVRRIGTLIGGSSSLDTLIGPQGLEANWEMTADNAGVVNGARFSGFENLTGQAEARDGFLLRVGGSVAGVIDGGVGSQDSIAVENPLAPGSLSVLLPASAAETLV